MKPITWLEHLRRYKKFKLSQLHQILGIHALGYWSLEQGTRRPSAKMTFALALLFEGYSFKALMLKDHFTRGNNRDGIGPVKKRLIEQYQHRRHAHLKYEDPLYRTAKTSVVGVPPCDHEQRTPHQKLPPQQPTRYRTGRWNRPWVARLRQVPSIRPAKINRLMERIG